jgi:hypothetical protein
MPVEPKTEEPTREMLSHAIRGEIPELGAAVKAAGTDVYLVSVVLCIIAAGYLAIDVSARWPTDADVREIARHTATTTTHFELSQQDVYEYISRAALGGELIDDVFPEVEAAFLLPVLITGRLLVAFCPKDKEWWEYLDTIWNAVNAAEVTDLSVLPALMLRFQRPREAEKHKHKPPSP